GQRIENGIRIRGDGAVIKSDDNFMIVERQRLGILHAANTLELAWADGKNAARAERVRAAGARLRCGRNKAKQPNEQHHYNAHQAPRPRATTIRTGGFPTVWRATLTEDYALWTQHGLVFQRFLIGEVNMRRLNARYLQPVQYARSGSLVFSVRAGKPATSGLSVTLCHERARSR